MCKWEDDDNDNDDEEEEEEEEEEDSEGCIKCMWCAVGVTAAAAVER